MKSVWQGTLSFGLVSIDVSLVSAINKNVVGFTLLCATCKTPITYERHCLHCDKPVSWDNVVKGLKTKNGYIVLTQEKIHELKPEKLIRLLFILLLTAISFVLSILKIIIIVYQEKKMMQLMHYFVVH